MFLPVVAAAGVPAMARKLAVSQYLGCPHASRHERSRVRPHRRSVARCWIVSLHARFVSRLLVGVRARPPRPHWDR